MQHERNFDPAYETAIEVMPGIRRMTVQNPGPFTFFGTNSYIIGHEDVAILDPGPLHEKHMHALLRATQGQKVEAILVSHTHMDHSPGAKALQAVTGAPIIGCAAHRPARDLAAMETNALDASADKDYRPDQELGDGERYAIGGFTLEAVPTPGHTANHLCFAVEGTEVLFSADHVMAWSTSIVAPPDGAMSDYMASLERLQARAEDHFLPGHGAAVTQAHEYMSALWDHRKAREKAIAGCLSGNPLSIPQIVELVYQGLDPMLKPAAGLSVFAHLEDLTSQGIVKAVPSASLQAVYMTP
ncbi:MBL fold metallo-hydrolase [Roseibium sp.]|uniref:MBL fold metallo-hydrolase n=1 Tax=Roseibium sp. TaxID=1936156 RepID=UPI003A974A63